MERCSHLGCPRKNQIFFRFEPKQTEAQSISVVFQFVSRNPKTFFWFVSVFRTIIETTETNRIFSKQTETNRKNLQKTFSIRGSSKSLIFFLGSNRNKPKLNLFWLFFGMLFLETPKKNFRFVLMFRTSIETTETNRTYGKGN